VAAATARITHYAWPGGVAAIFEASTPCAAVFGPGGWHVGAPDIVFADGPPARAEAAQLRLRKDIVEQIASLEFAGAALHTDFVHLGRYIARLEADQASAVLLVLGPKPAVLELTAGSLGVIEPASGKAADIVVKEARGWIIVITGSLHAQPSQAAPAPEAPAATASVAPVEVAPVEVTPVEVAPVEDTPVPVTPAAGHARAVTPQQLEPVFGRFAGEARYLLSPGAAENLPSEIAAELARVVSNGATGTVLQLLDGAHTLAEIASETGLTPAQVGGILEALVAHRLAFKYVSRPRRAAGASAPR